MSLLLDDEHSNFSHYALYVYNSGSSTHLLSSFSDSFWNHKRVAQVKSKDPCLVCAFQELHPHLSIPQVWRKLLEDQAPFYKAQHPYQGYSFTIPILCCSKCYPLCPLVGQLALVDHSDSKEGHLTLTTTSGSLSSL
jgi:hypothetical protein